MLDLQMINKISHLRDNLLMKVNEMTFDTLDNTCILQMPGT